MATTVPKTRLAKIGAVHLPIAVAPGVGQDILNENCQGDRPGKAH
ncbi:MULTISPECIES: hypothetical protein [Cyanophyceae]|nr:hypothetical protein [Nodosilinea sp. FACHB-141]